MSRIQHRHILQSPICDKQTDYAYRSNSGKLGSIVDDNGMVLPQFMDRAYKVELTRHPKRIKPDV
jgi:hypothetical protein